MDPRDPTAAPVCVAPRREGIEYFVEHCAALSGGSAAGISSASGPAAAGGRGSGSGSVAVSSSDGSAPHGPTLVLLTNYGSGAGDMRLTSAVAGAPLRFAHAMLAAENVRVLTPCLKPSQHLQRCFTRATQRRSPTDIPLSQHATCNSHCSPAAGLGACCTSRRQASPSPTWTCLQAAWCCTSGGRGALPSPCCGLTPPVSQQLQHRCGLAVSGEASF